MPRIPRGQQAGFVYHVINRGNGRATIFHKSQDYFGLRLFQTFQKPALSLSKGSIAALTNYESRSNRSSRSTALLCQSLAAVQSSRVQSNLRAVYKSSSCSNGPGPQTKDLELAA
jgi:hypothetical protein